MRRPGITLTVIGVALLAVAVWLEIGTEATRSYILYAGGGISLVVGVVRLLDRYPVAGTVSRVLAGALGLLAALAAGAGMIAWGWWVLDGSTNGDFDCMVGFIPCPALGVLAMAAGAVLALVALWFAVAGSIDLVRRR